MKLPPRTHHIIVTATVTPDGSIWIELLPENGAVIIARYHDWPHVIRNLQTLPTLGLSWTFRVTDATTEALRETPAVGGLH